MSVQSFMEEYCPMTDDYKPDYDGTELGAAKHSLRKWSAIHDPEVLQKHKIRKSADITGRTRLVDSLGEGLCISNDTCAMCDKHGSHFGSLPECEKCELQIHCGTDCYDDLSPFGTFMFEGDAGPLVEALQAVVNKLEGGK